MDGDLAEVQLPKNLMEVGEGVQDRASGAEGIGEVTPMHLLQDLVVAVVVVEEVATQDGIEIPTGPTLVFLLPEELIRRHLEVAVIEAVEAAGGRGRVQEVRPGEETVMIDISLCLELLLMTLISV